MKTPQRKAAAWPPRYVELLMRFANEPGRYGFYRSKPQAEEKTLSRLVMRGLLRPLPAPPYYMLTSKGQAAVERILTAATAIANRIAPAPEPKTLDDLKESIGGHRVWERTAVTRTRWCYGIPYDVEVPRGPRVTLADVARQGGQTYRAFMSDVLRQAARGMGLTREQLYASGGTFNTDMGQPWTPEPRRPGLGRWIETRIGTFIIDDDWLDRYENWKTLRTLFVERRLIQRREFKQVLDTVFARTDKLTNKRLERSIYGRARLLLKYGPPSGQTSFETLLHFARNTTVPK
jgi:hypothetical protein